MNIPEKMAAANEDGEFLDGNGMEASSKGCRSQWENLINLVAFAEVRGKRRAGGSSDSEPDEMTSIFGPFLL